MKKLILSLLLLPACTAFALGADTEQRRMFWGLDHQRTYACRVAEGQARRHAERRPDIRLVSVAECVCQTPVPDPQPQDSLLRAAGAAPHVQWNCVEARFVRNGWQAGE